MRRIVYRMSGTNKPRGGHKMAARHVEALGEMGFKAALMLPIDNVPPTWFEHSAPIIREPDLQSDDIVVMPEDGLAALRRYAAIPNKKVIFCQNHCGAASQGVGQLSAQELKHYTVYMACSETVGMWLARFMPYECIEVVPAFVDDQFFRPAERRLRISCNPSKIPMFYEAVIMMTKRMYRAPQGWETIIVQNMSEREVAHTLSQTSIYLSMNHYEGLGLSTLEAMASGCIPVGLTGIGGREYASTTNGYWQDDENAERCADNLVRAMMLANGDSLAVNMLRSAAQSTARQYGRDAFLLALRRFWERKI